ncbi:MAG TPA: AAA family ATPase [Acidimicrobiales bacterium]|nr:AAA family ATPase [Acidimicrobiales bacterium]
MPDHDLFEARLAERLHAQAPLAARMRPRSLDDVVGQEQLLGHGKPLRALIESDRLSSIILWGPPGTGKTTLARLIADVTKRDFVALSAVSAGVKDVRDTTAAARTRLSEHDVGTILFLDEVHRFNKAQQDALLPSVEEGILTLIGATTENPFFVLRGAYKGMSPDQGFSGGRHPTQLSRLPRRPASKRKSPRRGRRV